MEKDKGNEIGTKRRGRMERKRGTKNVPFALAVLAFVLAVP